MSVLKHLQPENVLRFFEEISAIPHGSGNTKAISDYCVRFAEKQGLEYWQDEANNVVIKKPATAGYEAAPVMILQGHLDMVCEKSADNTIDMTTEAITLCTDDQWIWADRTTLGADNGIAVAMALALLEDSTLQHPGLEIVLTTDEEIGMLGAAKLQMEKLQGRYMLNLDSEAEGILTVSCAGGVMAMCHVPVEREATNGVSCKLTISGLAGGHSGAEIHCGRANANMLMGRLLYGLTREMALRIVQINGGMADNAIASSCTAQVLVPVEELTRIEALTAAYASTFMAEYQTADPGLQVHFEAGLEGEQPAMTLVATSRVVSALMLLPNGIQTMSMDIPGLVQTSLNLGILRSDEQEVTAAFAVRSSVATEKAMLCNRIDCLATLLGGYASYAGAYPAWEYKRDSALRDLIAGVYEAQTGKKAVIEAIHAGLECGIFCGGLPGLDCVSLGPEMYDIHTPRERISIASVERTWKLVCEVLRRAKEL